MNTEVKFQIGKNGLTEGVIETLNNILRTHKRIRISVLKSSGRDKAGVKLMADEIKEKLGNCDAKIIGFTIILIRRLNKAKEFKYPKK